MAAGWAAYFIRNTEDSHGNLCLRAAWRKLPHLEKATQK